MKAPFTLKTLELARAAGWFRPFTSEDFMCFADALPNSVIWEAAPDWVVIYGNGYGEDEGTPPSYEAYWMDTDWEERKQAPVDSRAWHIYPDGRVVEL